MSDNTTIPFTNDPNAEHVKRQANPAFDLAMNAFWRTYHTQSTDVFQCVEAAVAAATLWRPAS